MEPDRIRRLLGTRIGTIRTEHARRRHSARTHATLEEAQARMRDNSGLRLVVNFIRRDDGRPSQAIWTRSRDHLECRTMHRGDRRPQWREG